jgi:hypothetical protein
MMVNKRLVSREPKLRERHTMIRKKLRPLVLVMLALGHAAAAESPLTLFGSGTPTTPVDPDTNPVTLGVKFYSTQAGKISGIRFYRGATSSSGYVARLFTASGTMLASTSVTSEPCQTVPCWEELDFSSPVSIAANTTYVAAYFVSGGHYAGDINGLANGVTSGPLVAPASSQVGGNGVYHYGSSIGFPNQSYQASNYWVDVSFAPSAPAPYLIMSFDPAAPSIPSTLPAGSSVAAVNVDWSDDVNGSHPFGGTLGFTTPYSNDSGRFGLSGDELVVASGGPGVGGDGGTTQNVSVLASQSGPSVSKNLAITVTQGAVQTPTSVSFSPPGPVNVNDNAAGGTVLAGVQVATSDGQPFVGTVSITSQSASGMTSLSSANLPSNVQVASINAADDGSQTVTVQSSENGVTKSATLSVNVTPANQGGGGGNILSADRDASANWQMAGMLSVGGIPNRTTVCATVSPLGNGQDDTGNINAAISNCAAGQVVSLAAGTFTINEGSIIQLNKAITLRGAGPTATFLTRTNGATLGSYFPGSNQSELIRISGSAASGSTAALTADAAQGSNSVQVSSAAGYSVGEIVLLDEASGSGWQTDRVNPNNEKVWASPDYRVVWNIHNPGMGGDDGAPSIYSYFQIHTDHPTNEMHQISAISGNTITFDSPLTISYRVSHQAQLTPMLTGPTNAGVEELAVKGGDNGNIRFETAAYAWAKDIDSSLWLNEGFALNSAFRVQLEGIYIHDAVWPVPGGGGYAISFAFGSSEDLIENSISVRANKVMVARASGAGSVIAYNYMDDGFISRSDGWVEIGLNASHLVGAHHVLFEGNWGFNADSDQTHGNSIYMTYFRNWLTGYRSKFTDYLNNQIVDDATGGSPRRAAAAHAYAYWFSFIGNVLGTAGKVSGWTYNCIGGVNTIPGDCIWDLGMVDISPQGWDPQVAPNTIQDGNYDYLTNTIHWASNDTAQTLPNSLYLSGKPAFFNAGEGYTWPWVNPTGSPQLYTLPAKARYDAGRPLTQP